MKQEELNEVIRKHKLWLNGKQGGKRACLYGRYLGFLSMKNADLRGADMSFVDLTHADLRHADLRGACIAWANWYLANTRGAKMYRSDAIFYSMSDKQRKLLNIFD